MIKRTFCTDMDAFCWQSSLSGANLLFQTPLVCQDRSWKTLSTWTPFTICFCARMIPFVDITSAFDTIIPNPLSSDVLHLYIVPVNEWADIRLPRRIKRQLLVKPQAASAGAPQGGVLLPLWHIRRWCALTFFIKIFQFMSKRSVGKKNQLKDNLVRVTPTYWLWRWIHTPSYWFLILQIKRSGQAQVLVSVLQHI